MWGLEKIVISGGAYHTGGDGKYQYEFVDSALLQISKLGGKATLLVASAGWTSVQTASIVMAVSDRGIKLVWFKNIDELTNYINTGNKNGVGNRKNDPITDFYVFAHGTDYDTGNYAIEFGMYATNEKDLHWSTEYIEKIECAAFSSNVKSKFYACRTGNTFSGNGNFAQEWANKTRGSVWAYQGAITAYGKSDYSKILGTDLERYGVGTKEYEAWKIARGDITAMPGEAWRLPTHSWKLSAMIIFYPEEQGSTLGK